MKLTPPERERGWVVFRCPAHGDLVATLPSAAVTCTCGKAARATRDGKVLHRETLRRKNASQKSLQIKGSKITKSPLREKTASDKESPSPTHGRSL